MAYDEELAERIRDLLAHRADVTEMKMFGGLAFLVDGQMAVAASGEGGLMVRVAPDIAEELADTTGAQPLEMRGRPMRGWLRVFDDEVSADPDLRRWVDLSLEFVATLPPKG